LGEPPTLQLQWHRHLIEGRGKNRGPGSKQWTERRAMDKYGEETSGGNMDEKRGEHKEERRGEKESSLQA
jgi:hypothetical protein